MTSAAKSKGNGYERELCAFLIKTFGGNFQRVPNSGAFTGASNAYRKDFLSDKQIRMFKGDVIPADHMPKIVLECKFYKEFMFHAMVKDEVKQLDMWIQQTVESADVGDIWFLCIKVNRKGTYVVFDAIHKHHFHLDNHTNYKTFVMTDLESFFEKNKLKIEDLTKADPKDEDPIYEISLEQAQARIKKALEDDTNKE